MHRFTPFALAGVVSAALLSLNVSTTRAADDTKDSNNSAASASDKSKPDSSSSNNTSNSNRSDSGSDASQAASQSRGAREAMATIEPSKAPGQDNVRGTVHFTAAPAGGLKVHAQITGLEPNSKHGFHIHEKADLSAPDLASAGGHFNPAMHKHGGPEGNERHGGDLGNLEADADGKANYEATIPGLTIDDAKTGVVGHSVIVHEKADDLKTDPSGNSGARIAGGVIKKGSGSASSSSSKERGDRSRGNRQSK
jgi:Cu-Zn family superoxide dismutase